MEAAPWGEMTTAIGVVDDRTHRCRPDRGCAACGRAVRYPEDPDEVDALSDSLTELVEVLGGPIMSALTRRQLDAIGVALPGIVRQASSRTRPTSPSSKACALRRADAGALCTRGNRAPCILQRCGCHRRRGCRHPQSTRQAPRVWTIGNGIGFGRWPYVAGLWEGGHIIVTLDPKEPSAAAGRRPPRRHHGLSRHAHALPRYGARRDIREREAGQSALRRVRRPMAPRPCGGNRVVYSPRGPRPLLFHRPQRRFLDIPMLRRHLETMVKMSPLLSYSLEILPNDDATALLGAGVSAIRALAT